MTLAGGFVLGCFVVVLVYCLCVFHVFVRLFGEFWRRAVLASCLVSRPGKRQLHLLIPLPPPFLVLPVRGRLVVLARLLILALAAPLSISRSL
jgi:hypothetical protein